MKHDVKERLISYINISHKLSFWSPDNAKLVKGMLLYDQ